MHRWTIRNRFFNIGYKQFKRCFDMAVKTYQTDYHEGEVIVKISLFDTVPEYSTIIKDFDIKDNFVYKYAEEITEAEFNEALYIEVWIAPSIYPGAKKHDFMGIRFKGNKKNIAKFYVQGDAHRARNVYQCMVSVLGKHHLVYESIYEDNV